MLPKVLGWLCLEARSHCSAARGRRILLGEGRIDDYTVGEKVEIPVSTSNGVRANLVQAGRGADYHMVLTLTNDFPQSRRVEVELPLEAKSAGAKLVKRDGWTIWRVSVPANGRASCPTDCRATDRLHRDGDSRPAQRR